MPFLSHGGITLRYERAGAGLPLVFVHGLLANHTFWDRQVALRQRFQVVRIDLRGHGDSSKPRGAYGMATFADDVRHLVTALGLQRCILIGWSMGGIVVQQALRLLGDRVGGLVLVGTTASATAAKGYPHGIKPEEQKALLHAAEHDYKNFTRDLATRQFKTGRTELVQWATQQLTKTPPYVAAQSLQALFGADQRKALAAISVPTLIIHGRHDAVLPFSAGEYLCKQIKGARLVAFEDSGHAPMLEETEHFDSELEAFATTLG
jgi:pimeloyl-[acyl-carrier protein] methyl ester esterase